MLAILLSFTEGNLMSTIVGESFKYSLSEAVKNQGFISQHLLDSDVDDEILVICRNQSKLLVELIKLFERVY
jgi:hypothetical protein